MSADQAGARSDALLAGIKEGDRRQIARAITEVENETPVGRAVMRQVYSRLGGARVLGVTGPPGAGKSTLVNALITELVARGRSVGIVAIDPSSPFSGGAILGDRIRMEQHSLSEHVFIRSLASRGHVGGLSRAVFRVVDVLDAAGYELIIVETVGAGQAEVDIAELADVRVVVCPPGLGDDVQAIKAGILEIADIFVISKCDMPMADKTELDLRFMTSAKRKTGTEQPIVRVTATTGEGVGRLADVVCAPEFGQAGRRLADAGQRMRRMLAQEAGNLMRERINELDSVRLDALCEALVQGEMRHEDAVLEAARLALEPDAGKALTAN